MTDILTKERRSWNMSRIKGKDTTPEKKVRSILHKNGYRFRLNRKDLPGKPDLVLPKYNLVIFVHGCFWHRHKDCPDAKLPKSNTDFWTTKLNKNVERDKKVRSSLEKLGWKVHVIWECDLKNTKKWLSDFQNYISH